MVLVALIAISAPTSEARRTAAVSVVKYGLPVPAANIITTSALDPFGKIPEVKFCAVKIYPGGIPEERIG